MRDQSPWRRDVLGASDAPAIAGVDPFRTSGDLWAAKTGRLPEPNAEDGDGMTAARVGQALGPLLVDYTARKLRRSVAAEVWYKHPTAPMACTLDGIALEPPAFFIEAKTAGLLGPVLPQHAEEYGDDGTDEVPKAVVVQVHHSFAVLDAQPDLPPIRDCYVPVLIGARGVRLYHVRCDEALMANIYTMEVDWWRLYVEGDHCPPNDPPSLPTLKAMFRHPEAPARIVDPVLVSEWLQSKEILKQAERNEETCRRFVLNELGDSEIGETTIGRVTYKAHSRAAYTVAAGTVRQLRFSPYGRARAVA